jgi:hypothetical protein
MVHEILAMRHTKVLPLGGTVMYTMAIDLHHHLCLDPEFGVKLTQW